MRLFVPRICIAALLTVVSVSSCGSVSSITEKASSTSTAATSGARDAPVPGNVDYVAFGDSAAAAPLVPDAASPAGCIKSANDYPSVLARRIAIHRFTDVTCSGATTQDIVARSQQTRLGPVAPQIDAIDAGTTLITITIGGNDVGLASAALSCRTTSLDTPSCADKFTAGGTDRLSTAIDAQVPHWAAMIDAVRAKAANARIILVGYGIYSRPEGCFPEQPIAPRDADYFQSKVHQLNDRQRELAADKRIDYFDITALSVGHDMCAAPGERYFEGFVLSHPAAPLHPNSLGAAAVGSALANHIG